MMRCLCCNKEIKDPGDYEKNIQWHVKCIRKFFGTDMLPNIELSEKELERLANSAVSKGLTVPGVQKKLSLHQYILKPGSDEYDCLPESEFLVMRMAETAKITTVPNAMVMLDGKYAYITKRIDRDSGKAFAMEDFCQLSERMTFDKYRSSYENCGKVIKQYSKNTGIDIAEFYCRLLFCFVTGNSDMHLKNFSLIEDAPCSRVFYLSPAYDMLPVNVIMPADKEQMALSLNGKKRNIRKKDFLVLAENLGISEKTAMKMMAQMVSYKDLFLKETEDSYISDDMKLRLKELIEARMKILAGNLSTFD